MQAEAAKFRNKLHVSEVALAPARQAARDPDLNKPKIMEAKPKLPPRRPLNLSPRPICSDAVARRLVRRQRENEWHQEILQAE